MNAVKAKQSKKNTSARVVLNGDPPGPINMLKGCSFAERCSIAIAECHKSRPELRIVGKNHTTALSLGRVNFCCK